MPQPLAPIHAAFHLPDTNIYRAVQGVVWFMIFLSIAMLIAEPMLPADPRLPAAFEPLGIPSVAYTDPEIAWVGLSETQAKQQGTAYEKGTFPWTASGRALSIGRSDGITKILVDPESRRILGAGIVGRNAGELIAEAVLALEMGADTEDVGLSIHPHPTLSETFGLAAEMAEGTITDLYAPKRE